MVGTSGNVSIRDGDVVAITLSGDLDEADTRSEYLEWCARLWALPPRSERRVCSRRADGGGGPEPE